VTRSLETWKIQSEMLRRKEAFCILTGEAGLADAGALFIYNNHTCYYGVGCSMEGADSHAIIWEAILHAKGLGCEWFEMGEQVFSGDEKTMNISKFKRGFGGFCQVRLIIEKEK